MNSNKLPNKNVCKIQEFIIYLTFCIRIIDTVFVKFTNTEFVTFLDTLHMTRKVSSQPIIELSAILFKYLLSSQIHVLGFQL